MSLPPLASVTQLAAFLKQTIDESDATANLMLDIASGMVRGALQQDLSLAANDVVLFDPIEGAHVLLDELPIVAVSLFEIRDETGAWSTVAPSNYTVSTRTGMVTALGGHGISWPTRPGSWRITYTHGFDTIPDTLVGVVLGVAGRAFVGELGVESERIGAYQVKYAMEADGFSPIEAKALARIRIARIA